MKKKYISVKVCIILFSNILLSAMLYSQNQSVQQFICTETDPSQGKIYPSGTVDIPLNGKTFFYSIAEDGYTQNGFYVSVDNEPAQFFPGKELIYEVTSISAPITIEASFQAVSDDSFPIVKIIEPDNESIIITGNNNEINIRFITEGNATGYQLFNNCQFVSENPVSQGNNVWSFNNVKLNEGDNVFLIKGFSQSSLIWSSSVDMLLVHYQSAAPLNHERAVILIDERLYNQPGLNNKINEYINLSEEKISNNYQILLDVEQGIDDWNTDMVKNHIAGLKQNYPFLEGILFIGNIKLPSYYAPRGDIPQSRLFSHKYEDLDIQLSKNNQTISADYDSMLPGINHYPEIWNAFVPVGYPGNAQENEYPDFAVQINSFLDKAISARISSIPYSGLYKVSNQLWDLSAVAYEYGLGRIHYYGLNDSGYGPYHYYDFSYPPLPGLPSNALELFYKRAPVDNFNSYHEFHKYTLRWPWAGENWQRDTVFIDHMQNSKYAMVWVNTHASSTWSLISSGQAKTLTSGGGVLMASGCSVAGFSQYGSSSYVDVSTSPEENLLCSYVYGSSDFLSAFGCPFNRGHEPEFNRLSAFIAQGDYTGIAHFFRKCIQYERSLIHPEAFTMDTQEIFIGDPFLTIKNAISGDANEDKNINIIDALLVAQYYVGLNVSISIINSDVNCDGRVNIVDALLIAQYYVGLIHVFPGCN